MITIKEIAFIVTGLNHISGISEITANLANILSEKKYKITIISLVDRSPQELVILNSSIKIIKIYKENISLKKLFIPLTYKLTKILKDSSFDIVITPLTLFPIIKKGVGNKKIKVIALDHASIPTNKNIRSIEYWNRKYAALRADCLVVVSEGAKEVYKSRYKNIKKIKTIHNTNDFNYKEIIHYNESSKKIISAGALVDIKGFDTAIEVGTLALADFPDWEWHIYGDGKEKNKLQKLIIDNKMNKQIKLMGKVDNLNKIYNKYSFFVLTSKLESFGMVLLEAKQNRLPIISFDCPYGPRELINHGINGVLIENGNSVEITRAIQKMIQTPSIRKEMSNSSYRNIEMFKVERIVDKWVTLFEELNSSK